MVSIFIIFSKSHNLNLEFGFFTSSYFLKKKSEVGKRVTIYLIRENILYVPVCIFLRVRNLHIQK